MPPNIQTDASGSTHSMPVWLMMLFGLMALSPVAAFQTLPPSSKPTSTVSASATPLPQTKPPASEHCIERWQTTFSEGIGAGTLVPDTKQAVVSWLGTEPVKQLGIDYQVYIATIPDPIDSGFAYMFQTHLQALRLGLEEHLDGKPTYYRTHSWLPWYETLEVKKALSEPCRRELPGVVLFRSDQESQAAVLLLVGESPTLGVHARAMSQALDIAAALGGLRARSVRQLSILGPTFSGSASSIRAALIRFADPPPPPAVVDTPPASNGKWTVTLTSEAGLPLSAAASSSNPKGKWTLAVEAIPPSADQSSPAPVSADGPPEATHSTRWMVSIVSGTASVSGLKKSLVSPLNGGYFRAGEVDFATTTIPERVLQCRYFYFLKHSLGERVESLHGHAADRRELGPSPIWSGGRDEFLTNVALLHESGTEFGSRGEHQQDEAKSQADDCALRPRVEATFPANIAGLRDAYEATDSEAKGSQRATRRTSLDGSLRENRAPPGVESDPSGKAILASDVALSQTIAAIGREGIRHVAIQATEVGDAIFLARKIRDVAPDVRIAIFQADTLLLHPSFQSLLRGSIVVTPYPFLGAAQLLFESSGNKNPTLYRPFENSAVHGVFNAALALRKGTLLDLREYALRRGTGPSKIPVYTSQDALAEIDPRYHVLPVWITGIGSRGFVPLLVAPSVLREEAAVLRENPIYESLASDDTRRLHGAALIADQDPKTSWKPPIERFNVNAPQEPSKQRRPRSWGVLTLLVCLFFIVDDLVLRSMRVEFPRLGALRRMRGGNERVVELATLRMKWKLYAAIRRLVGVLTIWYALFWTWRSQAPLCEAAFLHQEGSFAGVLSASGIFVRDYFYLLVGGFGLAYLSVVGMLPACAAFGREFLPFLRNRSEERTLRLPPWRRFLMELGWHRPERPPLIALISKYQARNLALLVGGALGILLFTQVRAIERASDILDDPSAWAKTLMTERTLNLVGGLSVAAPMLLLVGVFHLWTVSRMARLRLVHGVARMTPHDRIDDFVSTPIRMILQPTLHLGPHRQLPSPPPAGLPMEVDSALTRIERGSMHAIARPITGLYYLGAWVGVMALPLVFFMARVPDTLERDLGFPLLFMLYLAYAVIACSLLQLVQYWVALELLLKSTFQHWLGRAFERVAPFVQEPIDEQVSRTPNDLLRLAACVGEYDNLRRWAHRSENSVAADALPELNQTAADLRKCREHALESIEAYQRSERPFREKALGSALVAAAARLVWIVERERETTKSGAQAMPSRGVVADWGPGKASQVSEKCPDYSKANVAWIKDAEALAATVVAILINRHVRQFQHFIYPVLVSTVLFLCAILSYPFEPHRLMKSFAWSLLLVSVAAGVWIYLQLDRNSLLSKIAATQPGRITPSAGLMFRFLAWVIAPVLAALAADYPDLVHSIITWFAPGSGAR